MDENIVQEVQDIEAEADRIAAEAKDKAARLDESLAAETAALRKEREATLSDRLAALKDKLSQETASRLAEIEQSAQNATARLHSLDAGATGRALELILSRLREDGAWQ